MNSEKKSCSSYNLKNPVLTSRMFILQKSKLENSLSPLHYKNKPKKLAFSKKLKEIAEINPLRQKPKFEDDDLVPYVGMPQTDEHSKSVMEVILRPYKEVKGRNIIYPNDLLYARIEPSVFNKKIILTDDLKGYEFAFTSTEFYIVKGKNVDNHYLLANLLSSYVYNQIEGKVTGSTGRRRVDKSSFEETIIPFPLENNKREPVSNLIKNYFLHKQTNEAEAEKLLSSIDDYLLKELGISLPIPVENTLKNRIFTTSIKEISGGRFDPKLYSLLCKELIQSIYKTKFKHQSLKSTIVLSNAGDWGFDDKEKFNDEEFVRCLVIRATEFDNKINLKIDGSRAKFRLVDKLKYKLLDVQPNDLLIEKSGGSEKQPVGRVAILTSDLISENSLGFSNFVQKIRVDETIVLADYVFNYLKTLHNIKITDVMQSQTNGIKNLILGEYFNLPIPVPPLAKQKEIAEYITNIRNKAQALKDKTKNLLKKASEEIEEILLN